MFAMMMMMMMMMNTCQISNGKWVFAKISTNEKTFITYNNVHLLLCMIKPNLTPLMSEGICKNRMDQLVIISSKNMQV